MARCFFRHGSTSPKVTRVWYARGSEMKWVAKRVLSVLRRELALPSSRLLLKAKGGGHGFSRGIWQGTDEEGLKPRSLLGFYGPTKVVP